MNDPSIDELCQRIYTNHRQAIDLIWDRVGSTTSGLVASLAALVQQQADRWTVLSTTSKRVVFAPTAWRDLFPAVGERKTFDPHLWVVCRLEVGRAACRFAVQAWPATDAELRRRTIERLVQNPKEFGFKLFFKAGAGQKWTALCREEIVRWPEDDDPELDSVIANTQSKLEQAWARLAGVPDALRPLFDEWNRSQTAAAQR